MTIGLPREIIRWLQSLNLPFPVARPKTDLCNGYLIAEIAARYWQGVELHMYENKLSAKQRESNWSSLRKVFERNGFQTPPGLIEDVMAAKENAASYFLELFYRALTQREIQHLPPLGEAEVAAVPKFVKSTAPTLPDSVLQTAEQEQRIREQALLLQQQKAAESTPQKSTSDKDKARKVSPGRSPAARAKLTQKVQTIKSMTDVSGDPNQAQYVQFTNVTIKPLAPQALHRFGGPRASSPTEDPDGDRSETEAMGILTSILEKRLEETGTAPWPLSATVPTSAEYFARYSKSLPPQLSAILWSGLFSQETELAMSIVQHPWNFEPLLTSFLPTVFDARPFPRRSSLANTETEKVELDNARAFLRSLLTLIAQQNFTMMLFFVRTILLPRMAPTLHYGDRTERRAAISTLRCALPSEDPEASAISALLVVVYDFLTTRSPVTTAPNNDLPQPPPIPQKDTVVVAEDGFRTFLRLLFDFSELIAKKRTALPQSSADELVLGRSVARMVYFHAAGGLSRPDATVRTLAVAALRQLVRCGHVALVAPRLNDVAAQIGASSLGTSFELTAQSMMLVCDVISATYPPKSNGNSNGVPRTSSIGEEAENGGGEDTEKIVKGARVSAMLHFRHMCKRDFIMTLSVPTKIRLVFLKYFSSTLKYFDRELDESTAEVKELLAVMKEISPPSVEQLFSQTPNGHTLTTPLFGCGDMYDTSQLQNSCDTLAFVTAALPAQKAETRKPAKGQAAPGRSLKLTDDEASVLPWLRKFIVDRSPSLPLCAAETDVPLWWDQLRKMRDLLESAMYGAEMAADGDPVRSEQATIAMSIVIRFYVNLSGANILPEHRLIEHPDEQLQNNAIEWFRTIVPMSS